MANIVRWYTLIEHHEVTGEHLRRIFFEIEIRQVEATVLGFGNDMLTELVELISVFLNLKIQTLGSIQVSKIADW